MKPIYLILLCFLIVNSSCQKDDGPKLRVNNISEKAIYVKWTEAYPDTSLNHMANPTYNPQIFKVGAHRLQEDYYGDPDKSIFKYIDTLSVFIFDAEVLENTQWATVKAQYMVLKRYDLSLDDLNKLNWVLTYP